MKQKDLVNIKSSFLLSLSGEYYQNISHSHLEADYFSYFLRILNPNIRVANEKFLSDSERMENNHVAKLMCNYGIRFIQEMDFDPKTNVRVLNFKLDPYVYFIFRILLSKTFKLIIL